MSNARALHQAWLRLLEGGLAAETAAWLERECVRRGLCCDGHPVCSALNPLFVDGAEYRAHLLAAEEVYRALELLAGRLAGDAALRRAHKIPPRFDPLLAADRRPRPTLFPSRFDGFVDGSGTIRFLELNTLPAGISFSAGSGALMREAPPFARLPGGAALAFDSPFAPLRDELARLRTEAHPDGARLAIGAVASGAANEEDALLQELLDEAGADLVRGGPGEVALAGGRATVGGRAVDLLVLGHPAKLGGGDLTGHPLVAGLIAGAELPLARGIAESILLGRKSTLALASDEDLLRSLPANLAAAARRHVPWTRVLDDVRTGGPDGRTVELLAFVRAERARLVIKPTSLDGGQGVVRGREASAGEWEAAIEAGLARPHVVQERVDPAPWPLAFLRGGALTVEPRPVDLDPYLWRGGRARGAVSRFAGESGLTNHDHVGGGNVLPFLVVG
jgi:hypothetical protein